MPTMVQAAYSTAAVAAVSTVLGLGKKMMWGLMSSDVGLTY